MGRLRHDIVPYLYLLPAVGLLVTWSYSPLVRHT
jgi:hypothetical protein